MYWLCSQSTTKTTKRRHTVMQNNLLVNIMTFNIYLSPGSKFRLKTVVEHIVFLSYFWTYILPSTSGINFIRDHSFSRYAKFSEKLTFFTPWYDTLTHVCILGCKKCKFYAKFSKKLTSLTPWPLDTLTHVCILGCKRCKFCAKFSKKLTSLTPWYTHACMHIRV